MSGAVPPPAARPLGRAARVPRPVCPGCGRCGRGDPAPAPRRAPLRAGVARRGRGGRASPGGGAVRRCEGRLGSGAPPPPVARPLGGLPGLTGHVLWARVWVCAVCVVSVRCVSWCVVPLFSCPSGAPLSGALVRCGARRVPCACRAPFPARVPCSAAGYPLFRSWPGRSFPFPLLALLPGMHFFPASALVCLSVFHFAGFLYTSLHYTWTNQDPTQQHRNERAGYTNNIRLYDQRQHRDGTHANQADHEAAKTTAHQPHRSCSHNLTVNRPHASQPTPNLPGVHGSKRKRRPTGWQHRGAPRPPTTVPTNTAEHRNAANTNATNQR